MYVKFKEDSADLTSPDKVKSKDELRENLGKTLGLSFKKDEVRYETRGAELVKNGVATEVADYDAYLEENKVNAKKIAVTEKKASDEKKAPAK